MSSGSLEFCEIKCPYRPGGDLFMGDEEWNKRLEACKGLQVFLDLVVVGYDAEGHFTEAVEMGCGADSHTRPTVLGKQYFDSPHTIRDFRQQAGLPFDGLEVKVMDITDQPDGRREGRIHED